MTKVKAEVQRGDKTLIINFDVSKEGELGLLYKRAREEFRQKYPNELLSDDHVEISFDLA